MKEEIKIIILETDKPSNIHLANDWFEAYTSKLIVTNAKNFDMFVCVKAPIHMNDFFIIWKGDGYKLGQIINSDDYNQLINKEVYKVAASSNTLLEKDILNIDIMFIKNWCIKHNNGRRVKTAMIHIDTSDKESPKFLDDGHGNCVLTNTKNTYIREEVKDLLKKVLYEDIHINRYSDGSIDSIDYNELTNFINLNL